MRRDKLGAVGVLGCLLIAGAPGLAWGHGGHGGGGGGGHFSGGHAGGGGGGHFSGGHAGSAAHFGGAYGGAHAYGGVHSYGGGGVHPYAGPARSYGSYGGATGTRGLAYGGAYHGSYAGQGAYGYHGTNGYHGTSGYHGGYGGYHGGYGGYRGYHGYSSGAYWGGGWWHGGYWPHAYYGLGYAWFLPVLPLTYATYWYGGIPYYYANNIYYTWDPSYEGYVATDPPPVADPSGAATPPASNAAPAGDAAPYGDAAPGDGSIDADAPIAGGGAGMGAPGARAPSQSGPPGGQIFMYPANGQSPQQQALDKRECEKWASDQAGLGSNGPDFRRAMIACVQGRGYSAN